MQVKFYLRNTHEEGEYSKKTNERNISAYITFSGQRLRLATKLKVKEAEWNENREEIRGIGDEVAKKNARLKEIKKLIEKAYVSLLATSVPMTSINLKIEVLKLLFPEKYDRAAPEFNLLSFCKWNIDTNPKKVKHGTIKTYMQLVPLLEDIIQDEGKIFLEFNSLDIDWESTFTSFLFDKGHSRNTVGRHIKNIKSLMTLAYKKGLHTNLKYKDFKKLSEDVFSIFLTEDEIESIYKSELPVELEMAKDVFVFSCLTGLRFSDAMNIRKHHWDGDFLRIETIKTEDPLKIPLRRTAKEILKKYEGQLPKFYNSKYNKQIKEICSLVQTLNQDVSFYVSKGNVRKEVIKKKYLLVQSHTARRSFATNEYKRGTKPGIIMAITGHKTEKDFWTYIRMTQQEKAEDLFQDYLLRDF